MNTLNSISTLADALPLVYPSVDVEFLAHLVPIKEANQVLHHSPIGQFVTSPWTDPLVTTFVADGKIKCYFTWNGKKSFDKAEFTVTLCSKATMMVNDEQLVYGMPVDLHDCDTIQLFEFAKPTEGLPRIDVKFFYRIKHVFCSEKTGKTYMVLSRAGQGGYGTVHKCRNPDGEQRLAVKRTKAGALLPGGRCAESHEVVTLREIWEKVKEMKVVNQELGLPDIDPHVVMLRDHWVNGTSQLIVMDMALEDLHGRVSKNPSVQGSTRLVEAEVQSIARQVLTGLNFIHCMGYVHCDIKPANILMYGQREGAGDPYSHVVIADLGISQKETDLAKVAALGQTFLGTPGFLPPEVAGSTRVYSPLVDVWATGISLYYAYTGSYLFNGTSPELVQALTDQGEHLARLSELPVSYAAFEFICRCLQANHLQRPTAAQALFDEWFHFVPQPSAPFTPANVSNQLPALDYPMAFWPPPPALQAEQPQQVEKRGLNQDTSGEGQGGAHKRMRIAADPGPPEEAAQAGPVQQ